MVVLNICQNTISNIKCQGKNFDIDSKFSQYTFSNARIKKDNKNKLLTI